MQLNFQLLSHAIRYKQFNDNNSLRVQRILKIIKIIIITSKNHGYKITTSGAANYASYTLATKI